LGRHEKIGSVKRLYFDRILMPSGQLSVLYKTTHLSMTEPKQYLKKGSPDPICSGVAGVRSVSLRWSALTRLLHLATSTSTQTTISCIDLHLPLRGTLIGCVFQHSYCLLQVRRPSKNNSTAIIRINIDNVTINIKIFLF